MRVRSFQASLLMGLVPLVLLSAGAVYGLNAWREIRTKEELSQRIVRRAALYVEQRFDRILSEAELGARILSTGGQAGDLPGLVELVAATPVNAPPGREALAAAGQVSARLVSYLLNRPNTGAAQLASERGHGFMVLQLDDSRFRARVVNRTAWGPRALWLDIDSIGRPVSARWEASDYDPRGRPWYALAGVPANTVSWTEPSVMATSGELGMSASAWWTRNGVRWVGALDVLLLDITHFTQEHFLVFTAGTLTAVFTADWRAVGLPRVERFSTAAQQRAAFLAPVGNIAAPAISEALRSVEPIAVGQIKAVRIAAESRRWWAGVAKYPVPGTKGFLIVVTVPDSDLLLGVADVRSWALAATFAALVLALGVCAWLARSFARPIAALSEQSRRVEGLEFGELEPPATRVHEIRELTEAQQRSLRAVESFSRYVPLGVVRELVRRGEVARIGGGMRNVTALFTDVAGFTSISEQLGPGASADHLSGYFEFLVDEIEGRQGTVDKFVGDGVVAFWGAPADVPHAARRAVEAVLAIREGLARRNFEWSAQGRPPLPTRFSLATGPAIVGNMGATRRLAYTAIGDTMNLASRLEGANKGYGTAVLADAATRNEAGEGFAWRRVDCVRVVGRREPVVVHELLGRAGEVDAETLAYTKDYEAAWDLYAGRNFAAAAQSFTALARRRPDDATVVLFANCEMLAAHDPGPGWVPITELSTK